jgi:DNA-binding NarL/FixJ family response regulator
MTSTQAHALRCSRAGTRRTERRPHHTPAEGRPRVAPGPFALDAGRVDVADLLDQLDRVVRLVTEQRMLLDSVLGAREGAAAPPGLVERLTDRESAVLRRLPSPLSIAEIAGLSYVSSNTVKSQVQSIYRKLGVNSRHEAVERARQLGLL